MKTRVRQAFNRAAPSYTGAADIQRRVAVRLAAHLPPDLAPGLIIDAGCGTGLGLPLLHRAWPQASIVAVDLAERMLTQLRHENRPAGHAAVCGDVEFLPLADACADFYWSSLSLQWCALPAALGEARRVLKPGGRLAFATVTGETFHELRSAFAGIDEYSHSLDFLPPAAIEAAVVAAGFVAPTLRRETIVASYADLKTLLRAVRQVGASEIAGERRRGLLGKDSWRQVDARYRRGEDGLCPLTYDVLYVMARRAEEHR